MEGGSEARFWMFSIKSRLRLIIHFGATLEF